MIVREIPIASGEIALIDEADWPLVSRYTWCVSRGEWGVYVVTNVVINGKRTMRKLHRLIMDAPPSLLVDHKNHNGLDNRRSNLRLCTTAQNGANARPSRNSTSGYKGVSWHKQCGKWRAHITIARRVIHLGLFEDAWDAAQAYNAAAIEQWGEFAHVNEKRIVAELLGGISLRGVK